MFELWFTGQHVALMMFQLKKKVYNNNLTLKAVHNLYKIKDCFTFASPSTPSTPKKLFEVIRKMSTVFEKNSPSQKNDILCHY